MNFMRPQVSGSGLIFRAYGRAVNAVRISHRVN